MIFPSNYKEMWEEIRDDFIILKTDTNSLSDIGYVDIGQFIDNLLTAKQKIEVINWVLCHPSKQ